MVGFIFASNKTKHYDLWIKSKCLKKIYALHAPVLWLMFYLTNGVAYNPDFPSSRNASVEIIFNISMIPLAILLWDGGLIQTTIPIHGLLYTLHHAGAMIALHFHIYESNSLVASRNTHTFAWLWFIHSFSFIQTYILPFFGWKETSDGKKSRVLKWVRYAYAGRTVATLYSYFNDEGQPGLGWNYQTVSLTSLLLGRHLSHHSDVAWMRHVEIPGTVFVYCSAMCGYNASHGVVTTAAIYSCCLVLSARKPNIRPAKWDPMHPEIAKILSKYEKKFLVEFPDGLLPGLGTSHPVNIDTMKSIFAGYPEWRENYPLIFAVAINDAKKVEELIQKGADPYTQMNEYFDSTPDEWAAFAGRIHCTMTILKAGVDPWQIHGNRSMWQIAIMLNVGPLLEMKAELEQISLKVYPPVGQETFLGRCWNCICEF